MDLSIQDGFLYINLNWKEKIVSISGSRKISLKHISSTDTTYGRIPMGIRLPGTYIPWLVAAGTYYTKKGKEFWCLIGKKKILRIELHDEPYARLILGINENESWKEKLDTLV